MNPQSHQKDTDMTWMSRRVPNQFVVDDGMDDESSFSSSTSSIPSPRSRKCKRVPNPQVTTAGVGAITNMLIGAIAQMLRASNTVQIADAERRLVRERLAAEDRRFAAEQEIANAERRLEAEAKRFEADFRLRQEKHLDERRASRVNLIVDSIVKLRQGGAEAPQFLFRLLEDTFKTYYGNPSSDIDNE